MGLRSLQERIFPNGGNPSGMGDIYNFAYQRPLQFCRYYLRRTWIWWVLEGDNFVAKNIWTIEGYVEYSECMGKDMASIFETGKFSIEMLEGPKFL